MSASIHTPKLVSADAYEAACATARSIRVQRYALWRLSPKASCNPMDPIEIDPPIIWHRIYVSSDKDAAMARSKPCYAWLLTEEQHDVLGNIYNVDGNQILPSWQPGGTGLLRTADNPSHWIPIHSLYPWGGIAPIAISSMARPSDWSQPRQPHYQVETDVWVHFMESDGPFAHRRVLSKMQAPRHTTAAMRAFLELTPPSAPYPSAADMTTAVIHYIAANMLSSATDTQTILPDQKLAELFGSSSPFPLTALQRLLAPHYGEFV
jgi:hypothetical protein